MLLSYVFLLLAFIIVACFVAGIMVKRSNPGFLLFTVLVIASDLICFAVIGAAGVDSVKRSLTIYYICHSWRIFALMWTVVALGRYRRVAVNMIPVGIVCAYQTVILAASLFGVRIFNISRHILLGRNWWIAESSRLAPVLFGFDAYMALHYLNMAICIIAIVIYCIHSDRLFRARYYVFIMGLLICVALEVVTQLRGLPVWICNIAINLLCLIGHYFTNYYSTNRLRDWSLTKFANEMSDGFVLYDEYDDLIHMNDLLRNTLPEELLTEFGDRSRLDNWIADTVSVGDMEVVECSARSGDSVYFKTGRIELSSDDYTLGTIYILHNSTETILRMKAMEKVNYELERTARMKSDFLANMSHEIRTPMNAVIGIAEIALREDMTPQLRDYLTQIQSSGRNLLGIINDILDFSKIEAGRMEIIPGRYEPLSEVNDIANILVTRIGDKKLELFVDVDERLPHALEGDSMRIRQVIINLANNAIKFTNEGIVCIRVICEKTSYDEVMLTYHVIDSGIGIREEDIGRLFNSFEQVDSRRNRAVEGTGLGLAISKRLVESMGGTIGVESEYGKGSDFYFSIPQRILDKTRDIKVDDAENKYAFVVNQREDMAGKFIEEMNKLKVDSGWLRDFMEYKPTGKRDYVFFEKDVYDDRVRELLLSYPECTGVILVDFDDPYKPDLPNLKLMRRPETTLGMLMIMNGKEAGEYTAEADRVYKIDYTAPDARILIVDDNPINITIAEGLLEPIGAHCTGAMSGAEAIDKLKSDRFDLVLMDHMMPEMDGVEATHIIRETIDSEHIIPIVAVTANVMEGVRDMFVAEGMDDFVGKPIDVRELTAVVRRLLPADKVHPVSEHYTGRISASESDTGRKPGTASVSSSAGGKASSSEDDLIEYDCLDYSAALDKIGIVKLYNKIVREYYESGASKLKMIRKEYETGDWEHYIVDVHALKSASRQIGAFGLGDTAERLELAGKQNDIDVIKSDTDKLLEDYAVLLDSLSGYFRTRKKVLIIDDDALSLKYIRNCLGDRYDVASAKGAAVAYKYLESRTADVILLDYVMPGESGPEVFTHIRQMDGEIRNVPIVFLTGTEDNSKTAQALALMPDGYLAKPVNPKKLTDMIESLTGR